MATLTSRSPAETERIGEQFGRAAAPGWVIGITGGLGAGKTCLVRGIARALKVPERVQSPTFALVHEYRGGIVPLYHLDLYRLDTAEQIIAAGLDDYLDPREGITVVEWYDRWTGPPPPRLHAIRIEDAGPEERLIHHHAPRP